MQIVDIYSKHKSNSCGDILLHVYRNGKCAYCRLDIVKIMRKNNVLSNEIIQECLYDSYDETRSYAYKIINKNILEK